MAKNKQLQEVLFHFLFWTLYVLSEYLANILHIQRGDSVSFLQGTLLSLPVLMIPTYFIARYAVPRFLLQKKMHWFLLSVLLSGALVFMGRIKWMELINYLDHQHYFRIPPAKVLKNVIRDYAIIALAVCIYIIGDWRKQQLVNEQLIRAKAEAEIQLLKGQLQPHFLFNSLNNIYSLALMKSDLTADSILKLTELLDFLVYRANLEKVTLTRELQLLKNYIALEQLRYGEKLKIETQLQEQIEPIKIAPLLLLPFAENCFKHGGIGKNGFFIIKIILSIVDDQLIFQIENSKRTRKRMGNISGGVGLKNIRKRLQLLYPKKYDLQIEDGSDFYKVQLILNLK